jgi:hypothetical protein
VAERASTHDQQTARKFLQFLFSTTAAGYIELRSIRPGGGALKPEFFSVRDPGAAAARAIELRAGADVYFGVAPRIEESGKAVAVAEAPGLWADIDTDEARAGLARFPLIPSIVVRSGSGENVHVYWALDKPTGADEAERLMSLLAEQIDSDRRVTDRARILRVPGTLNHKRGEATAVTLELVTELRYSLAQLRAALGLDSPGEDEFTSPPGRQDTDSPDADPASKPVKRVLGKLEGLRGGDGQWQALCPAHDDNNPSLSITEAEDGNCLLHCFAGCTLDEVLAALDLDRTSLSTGSRSRRQASRLLRLVEDRGVEFFHSSRSPFAARRVDGHLRTWPVESAGFEQVLRCIQWEANGEALGETMLKEAIATLATKAVFGDDERPVFRRVAGLGDRILIDVGDESGHAIEVIADDWNVIRGHDVHFIREADDLPFPIPERGGSIEELHDFTNCASEADFRLYVGGVIAAFHPTGPYPLLYITGEQGSAKTTHSKLVADLADPRKAPLLMGAPSKKDLAVIGVGVRLVGFDNVSGVRPHLSDMLCQLLTGAGHRDRKLYSNADQNVLEMKLPVHMNGIGNVITRPDLQDRTLVVELRPIAPGERRPDEDFWADWEGARGRIFGAILDGIGSALANYRSIKFDALPRMADCARWVEAAGKAYGWEQGSFIEAMEGGQAELAEGSVEGEPVLQELIDLVTEKGEWKESSAKLLQTLAARRDDDAGLPHNWPKQPDQLTKLLKRFEPELRRRGIEFQVIRKPGGNRNREIHLWSRDTGTRRDAQS